MKNFFKENWLLFVVIIVCLALMYSVGYEKARSKQLRVDLNIKEVAKNTAVEDKENEIERILSERQFMLDRLVEVDKKLAVIASERTKWAIEREELKRLVATVTPTELVEDVKEILEVDEIIENDFGIVFSIDAFRKASYVIYDWQEFSLVKEPAYLNELAEKDTKIMLLNNNIINLQTEIETTKDIVDIQMAFNRDLKDFVAKSDKRNTWSAVKNVVFGVATGIVVGFVLK